MIENTAGEESEREPSEIQRALEPLTDTVKVQFRTEIDQPLQLVTLKIYGQRMAAINKNGRAILPKSSGRVTAFANLFEITMVSYHRKGEDALIKMAQAASAAEEIKKRRASERALGSLA